MPKRGIRRLEGSRLDVGRAVGHGVGVEEGRNGGSFRRKLKEDGSWLEEDRPSPSSSPSARREDQLL